EILTGRPTYTGSRAVIRAHAELGLVDEAFARLDACGADLELVVISKRCLAKEPVDRFADAKAVAEAVAAHRAGVEKRLRAAEVRAAKRRWQVAVVGCVGLLMLGGVVAAWWMDRHETRKRAEIDAKEYERKLAAAQAEFDRDARKQQAEERVPRLMEQALALRRQCKFREAENLLNQAAA